MSSKPYTEPLFLAIHGSITNTRIAIFADLHSGCVLHVLAREVSPMVWNTVVVSTVEIKCLNVPGITSELIFRMLYSFLWVIPWHLKFMCQCFITHCLFHLHRSCKQEELKNTTFRTWQKFEIKNDLSNFFILTLW